MKTIIKPLKSRYISKTRFFPNKSLCYSQGVSSSNLNIDNRNVEKIPEVTALNQSKYCSINERYSYKTLNYLTVTNDLSKAEKFFNEIPKLGIAYQTSHFNNMLSLYSKQNEKEKFLKLLSTAIKTKKANYDTRSLTFHFFLGFNVMEAEKFLKNWWRSCRTISFDEYQSLESKIDIFIAKVLWGYIYPNDISSFSSEKVKPSSELKLSTSGLLMAEKAFWKIPENYSGRTWTPYQYNTLLDAYFKTKDEKKFMALFRHLIKTNNLSKATQSDNNDHPTGRNSIRNQNENLSAIQQEGENLIMNLVSSEWTVTYNICIKFFISVSNEIKTAEKFLKEYLIPLKLQADAEEAAAASADSGSGDDNDVKTSKKNNIKKSSPLLENSNIFTTMITYASKSGNYEAIEKYLQWMKEINIKPNEQLIRTLSGCYKVYGKLDKLKELQATYYRNYVGNMDDIEKLKLEFSDYLNRLRRSQNNDIPQENQEIECLHEVRAADDADWSIEKNIHYSVLQVLQHLNSKRKPEDIKEFFEMLQKDFNYEGIGIVNNFYFRFLCENMYFQEAGIFKLQVLHQEKRRLMAKKPAIGITREFLHIATEYLIHMHLALHPEKYGSLKFQLEEVEMYKKSMEIQSSFQRNIDMQKFEILGNRIDLIDAETMSKMIDEIFELFKKFSFAFDNVLFTNLIKLHLSRKELSKALQCFTDVMEKYKLEPNFVSVTLLLDYEKQNAVDHNVFRQVYQFARARGFKFNKYLL